MLCRLAAATAAALAALFPAGLLLAQEAAEQATATAKRVVPGSELESLAGPALRMVLSLTAVLLILGGCAWLLRRFRQGTLQGGLIQIVSGISLGPKERVVLLRVGDEEILVGLSPAGMRSLHVMEKPSGGQKFSLKMGEQS